MQLYPWQEKALNELQNGRILCGSVGSGKSRTALAYYFNSQGGDCLNDIPMKEPCDLYIITTAMKRDRHEWDLELLPFLMNIDPEVSNYEHKVVIDSWNNIKKYVDVTNAFFIFDEQRVVGYGAWTKAFLKITKVNKWILLSATPGDTWMDYMPVFIANGWYKNKTDFTSRHCVYARFSKYPKIERFVETGRLIRLRNQILIPMDFERKTESHDIDIWCDYDFLQYKKIMKEQFNYKEGRPMENAGELCYALRELVNLDDSRFRNLDAIFLKHFKLIVFYNFDYELDAIKEHFSTLSYKYTKNVEIAEWNGHCHEPIPNTAGWLYLVQYNAGAEGWNCITTDAMVFFSQNYSYRMTIQAAGRINRANTNFKDLYFYHFKSKAGIDLAINKALKQKKKFNELSWYNESQR